MCRYYDHQIHRHYNDYINNFCSHEGLSIPMFFKLLEKVPNIGKFQDKELGMNGEGKLCVRNIRVSLVRSYEGDNLHMPKLIIEDLLGNVKTYFILKTSDRTAELFEAESNGSERIKAEIAMVFLPC